MSIKLIASDMDGTLLTDGKTITAPVARAIRTATNRGIRFILATGRMYEAALPYARELELTTPMIAYNGALVKDPVTGETLYENFMDLSLTQELLQYCRQRQIHIQAYWGGEVYTDRLNDYSLQYSRIIKKPVLEIGEELFAARHPVYKLLAMMDPEDIPQVWRDLEQRFTGRIDLTSSAQTFLEIISPGINKWTAVKFLAARYHIRPEEIMCIGDSLNDLSMIEGAKVGVAVDNAHEEIKFHARHIVADNNNGGVAEAIRIALDLE